MLYEELQTRGARSSRFEKSPRVLDGSHANNSAKRSSPRSVRPGQHGSSSTDSVGSQNRCLGTGPQAGQTSLCSGRTVSIYDSEPNLWKWDLDVAGNCCPRVPLPVRFSAPFLEVPSPNPTGFLQEGRARRVCHHHVPGHYQLLIGACSTKDLLFVGQSNSGLSINMTLIPGAALTTSVPAAQSFASASQNPGSGRSGAELACTKLAHSGCSTVAKHSGASASSNNRPSTSHEIPAPYQHTSEVFHSPVSLKFFPTLLIRAAWQYTEASHRRTSTRGTVCSQVCLRAEVHQEEEKLELIVTKKEKRRMRHAACRPSLQDQRVLPRACYNKAVPNWQQWQPAPSLSAQWTHSSAATLTPAPEATEQWRSIQGHDGWKSRDFSTASSELWTIFVTQAVNCRPAL